MKKFIFILLLINQSFALEVMDKPDKNSNLLIIGDASKLKVLEDSYVHVYDPKTKVSGYVKYSAFQKALGTSEVVKRFPNLSGVVNKEEMLNNKAAILTQNIKNKQAQIKDLQSRLYQ